MPRLHLGTLQKIHPQNNKDQIKKYIIKGLAVRSKVILEFDCVLHQLLGTTMPAFSFGFCLLDFFYFVLF